MGEHSVKCANCESAFVTDRLPDSCPVCGRTVYAMAAPAPMPEEVKEAAKLLRQYAEEAGPCDHDANVCVCGILRTADALEASFASQSRRLAEMEAERDEATAAAHCANGALQEQSVQLRAEEAEVERLRGHFRNGACDGPDCGLHQSLEIERDHRESAEARVGELEAERDCYKAALEKIAQRIPVSPEGHIAVAALRATEAPHE